MGVLNVKAGRFHGSESRFYLPSLFVCQNRVLGAVEAYENLQFRNSFGVFDSTAGKIDILTFVKKELMEEFLLTDLQIIEQPPCTDSLNGGGLDNPEVLTYSDVIPYATAVEPSCPFLPDEFAVCHKAVDTFRSEKTDKAFHNLLAFLPVGVATFREKVEYQREGNPYPTDYNECTVVAREELDNGIRPELSDTVENLDDYDVVFVGCPVWWHTAPMAIWSFLENSEHDFSDKIIVPFCTYASTYR